MINLGQNWLNSFFDELGIRCPYIFSLIGLGLGLDGLMSLNIILPRPMTLFMEAYNNFSTC